MNISLKFLYLYQREYSWELEQVSDLFYDIKIANEENKHFLGSILLYAKNQNTREIIDGQQRLTTVFLILYSIRNKLKVIESNDKNDPRIPNAIKIIDNIIYTKSKKASVIDDTNEPRLQPTKKDRKLFHAILKGEDPDKHKKDKKSHKLLLTALNTFLNEKIEGIVKSDGVTGLLNYLDNVTECQYIVMTAEVEEDQFLLFKTLNSRGLELSESDLIKNEICNSAKGISKEESVEMWDEMRDILEREKVNIDVFMFHYINSLSDSFQIRKSIEQNRVNPQKSIDSYPPVPEKFVFPVYSNKLKSLSNTSSFLEDLKTAAENYVEIYNPQPEKVYLMGLKAMGITKCYPLLLRGKEILNDKNFDLLSKAVECISFRHSIIKSDPKDLEKLYYTLLNKLNSDNDIEAIIEEIKSHPTMNTKADKKFKDEFILASPKSSVSKMILDRLIRQAGESINWKSKDIHLEHIMPQRPKDSWLELKNKDAELYELSLNRIGNLTLIKDKINQRAQNRDFELKKNIYKDTRLKINANLMNYDKWDFDSIDKRQEELFLQAKEIWKI